MKKLPGVKLTVNESVPIVGIGSSAGGLEALEQFFKPVPPTCNLAFVVIQHLDPTHKALMVELLQRATVLPVAQITDRMEIAPNHIYVIPPNKDLAVLHGVLYLMEPVAPRGLRLPIDFFFRSLAQDQQGNGIGVILSGMGSDGTLGLRAIKEQAGVGFVQDPVSAKFDGMPKSAIDARVVDVVAPAEELAGKIISYYQHMQPIAISTLAGREVKDQSGLEKVVLILRTQVGHDFSFYKKSTLYRRIERRMGLQQLHKIDEYVRYLRENPEETKLLFKELLIGVTSFFRDPNVWEQLKTEVIPALLTAHPNGGVLRAWTPACSTGEEAYSLAIVFCEVLEQEKPAVHYELQIFATDLDQESIELARAGVYPTNISSDVSDERLNRFFMQDESGLRVNKVIREMVVFAPQNLVMDPPFTKLDILTCRNLLIYLEASLQKKLLPLFHYSLNPGGILVLGTSETVGQASDLFTPLSPNKLRIYQRHDYSKNVVPVDFPAMPSYVRTTTGLPETAGVKLPSSTNNLQSLVDGLLLRHYSPAAVLVNKQGDLIYVSGKTGKYLEPAIGKASVNIFSMAREGLAGIMDTAFAKAIRKESIVELKGVKVGTNGGTLAVDVIFQPLIKPQELHGTVLIVFTDIATSPVTKTSKKNLLTGQKHNAELATITEALQLSREELQTTREEMQSSQEELKSTNEELQSTNEELQSTNEELTTSKEEMQSMNEELQTVNHELTAKVDELSRASDDMKNLLNSTEIATLFLDENLKVRRFTTQATDIIKLIPGDAGRPITDLATSLNYTELAEDAHEVLRTLVFQERQVSARDGRWFTVRIMPYRTQTNRIDGVVITFVEISKLKKMEALQQRIAKHFELAVKIGKTGIWTWDLETNKHAWTKEIWQLYGLDPNSYEASYESWMQSIYPEDRDMLAAAVQEAASSESDLDAEWRVNMPDKSIRWLLLRGQPQCDVKGDVTSYLGVVVDVTERKQTETTLRLMQFAMDDALDAIGWLDYKGDFQYSNKSLCHLLEYSDKELLKMSVYKVDPAFARETFSDFWQKLKQEKTYSSDGTFRAKSGRIALVAIRYTYVEFEDNAVVCVYARESSEPKG